VGARTGDSADNSTEIVKAARATAA